MSFTPVTVVLGTSVVVLCVGILGVIVRRTPLALFMSVELMLNAAILALVGGSRMTGAVEGQSAALLVFVLAAAEAVVGLSLALALFRNKDSADIDESRSLVG